MQCKSFSHYFNKNYWRISVINILNFNDTLTNDVVSFEQPGPGIFLLKYEFSYIKNAKIVVLIFMSSYLKTMTFYYKRSPINNPVLYHSAKKLLCSIIVGYRKNDIFFS